MKHRKGFLPFLLVLVMLLFTADGISVEQWADPRSLATIRGLARVILVNTTGSTPLLHTVTH